ncbi:MAG: HYR domain-containing protein, partial [Planctomycetota bacterium]|nr:HYR domain-containing protein [Planctomycetota bacterium]
MVCDSCITVLDPPPVAGFLATPTSGAGPLEVEFTDQSSGLISSRLWDFGDPDSGSENSSDLASPFHLYQQPGTYQVTLVVTGPGGEDTSICSSCVVVTDEGAPEILDMPLDMLLGTDPGECQAIASWIEPTATDNFGLSTLVSDHLSGDAFPVGETLVTYIATDLAGNETSSSFSVTVEDQEPPQLIGMPSDIDLDSSPALCSTIHVWDAPTAIDNCGVATLTSDHQSGDTFALGATTVSYSATDIHGNTISSSFTVSVHDLESPSISGLPAEMSLQSEPGSCSAMANWASPLITDNCGVASSGSDFSSGDTFGIGTTTVTYSATDNSGNSSTFAFMITVEDGEDPTISAMPADLTVENDLGSCGAMVTWSEPLVEDNCPGSEISSDQMSGSIFAQGISTVTYTAMDQAGNTSTSSFTVSVLDGESPTVSGMPNDMDVEIDPGSCGAVVTWTEPTASDNCGAPSLTSDFFSGTVFPIGDTVVSYLATDDSGNTSPASFMITVRDTESPTLIAIPTAIEISTDPGLCSGIATWSDPVAIDNCGIASLSGDHSSGESFPRGMTTVTYTAIDDNGNTTVVSFTITVTDEEAPIISGMPTDMTVENTKGTCSAMVSWVDPLVSENCGSATLEADQRPGSRFPIGSTNVNYTATDSSGNSSTSFFTVTVLDTEMPTITGLSGDLLIDNDPGTCGAVATWMEPVASDNCSLQSLAGDHLSGSTFAMGDTVVSYLATDESGNTTTNSFTITVLDSESPTITGLSGDLLIDNDPGT